MILVLCLPSYICAYWGNPACGWNKVAEMNLDEFMLRKFIILTALSHLHASVASISEINERTKI